MLYISEILMVSTVIKEPRNMLCLDITKPSIQPFYFDTGFLELNSCHFSGPKRKGVCVEKC